MASASKDVAHEAPGEHVPTPGVPEPRPTERIGLAVVGAGYWGPNLVRNAQQTPALKLHWLCDLDDARSRRVLGEYSTVTATTSFEEVLADERVRAVAIATPAAAHYRLVRAALEAGKHVLVEKPITTTVADAAELVELAEARGLVLMCDHTFCYTPVVRRIRELVHGGEIGDVQFFDSVRINLGLVQPDVDVLWDLAPHDLSILDFVLPPGVEPIGVSAQGADPIGAGRACVAYLTVRLSNGALAHCHVNWLSPTKVRTTLIGGSRRTLVWDDLNPHTRLAIHGPRRRPDPAGRAHRRHPAPRADLLPGRRRGRPRPGRTGGAAQRDGRVRRRHHRGPRPAHRRPLGPAGAATAARRLPQPRTRRRHRTGRARCRRPRRRPRQ